MVNQVSVAEGIAKMSTAGLELAQQLYVASEEEVRKNREEMNALRSQLQNLEVLLETMHFDEMSYLIDETKLENTLKEAPCLQTPSINEVSFPQDFSSSLRPQFSFEHDSETLGFETGRQSCSSSLTDSGFDDENEDELNLNKEDATHLILGDIQIFSPTQTFVQSMLKSTQLELSDSTLRRPEILESETSPRIQITHARETGLNSGLLLSKAHARRISGCSTLQGSVHEDEEFPMRKDGNEDVIQVIEIPLKPLGRKRGSSLFGTIKKVVSKH